MPKVERNFLYQLNELAEWLRRGGRARNTTEEVQHQVNKAKKKGGDFMDDLGALASDIEKGAKRFVSDLENEPDDGEKLAREFEDKATKVLRKVDDVLANPEDLTKEAKSALTQIKKAITSALSSVKNFLKGLFSSKPEEVVDKKSKSYSPKHDFTANQAKRDKIREKYNIPKVKTTTKPSTHRTGSRGK